MALNSRKEVYLINYLARKEGGIMGQQETYDFLEKNKRGWFTAKEISNALKLSISSVTLSLKKLRNRKASIIKFKEGFTPAKDGSPRRCLRYKL